MADNRTEDVPARLAYVVRRLSRRIRAAGGSLSYGSLSALATVQKNGPIRLADLAGQEFISPPSTTRLVADLERRGLVTRTVDPADGRAFLVTTTEAGDAEVERVRAVHGTLVAALLDELTQEEITTIGTALSVLERALEGDGNAQRR